MESCPSRISKHMQPKEYIQTKLTELKTNFDFDKISDKETLKTEIFRLLMSKKFRKYSVTESYKEHIKDAISIRVDRNEPIKLTFPFGGYKLWRLPQSPEIDWAELFVLIYFSKWLQKICEIYKPGISFVFYSDDIIVSRMNNVPEADTDSYRESFKSLIRFIEDYVPANLKFTYERVIDQYSSQKEFEEDLNSRIDQVNAEFGNKLPELDEKKKASIDLNVKPTKEQLLDPFWREKNHILHQAYLGVKYKRPYYRTEDNILIFTTQITDCLSVGTTKHSIAKFWCGIGVLEKSGDDFNQLILSPSQIEKNKLEKIEIRIDGLDGKNFNTINIL